MYITMTNTIDSRLEEVLKAEQTALQNYYKELAAWRAFPSPMFQKSMVDAQDKWIEARRRTNAVLDLIYWSRRECECNGDGDACKPCRARARLKDEEYDPLCSTF